MNKVTILAPNQLSFQDGNKLVFQSYNTIVCTIENGKVQITEGQPQGTTTAKWLNKFLQLHTSFNSHKDVK